MANELEILTENADGDGWVDALPNAISTGYQAQNTNITARTVGQDLSSIYVDADNAEAIVEVSGPIDVDGLPYYVTEEITLSLSSDAVYYIQVVDGSTSTQKTLELTETEPTWDAEKNAYYNGDNRVLNWLIECGEIVGYSDNYQVTRIIPSSDGKAGTLGGFVSDGYYGNSKDYGSYTSDGTEIPILPSGIIALNLQLEGGSSTVNTVISLQKYINGAWYSLASLSALDGETESTTIGCLAVGRLAGSNGQDTRLSESGFTSSYSLTLNWKRF